MRTEKEIRDEYSKVLAQMKTLPHWHKAYNNLGQRLLTLHYVLDVPLKDKSKVDKLTYSKKTLDLLSCFW